MTAAELLKEIWELIENSEEELEQQEYLEMLRDLRDEANARAEVVAEEIGDDPDINDEA